MDEKMSENGRKGKIVRMLIDARTRGETYDSVFARYPQYKDLQGYAIKIVEKRHPQANQPKLPDAPAQTRLRQGPPVYTTKGDGFTLKFQVTLDEAARNNHNASAQEEIDRLHLELEKLDSYRKMNEIFRDEIERLKKEIQALEKIIDGYATRRELRG